MVTPGMMILDIMCQTHMTRLEEIEKAAAALTPSEKAKLVQSLVRGMGDSFPGVESRPDVCGGEPCIVRTRIPVWVLEQARRLGTSEADILKSYPTLRAEDLASAWAYVRAHPDQIEEQIAANEAA